MPSAAGFVPTGTLSGDAAEANRGPRGGGPGRGRADINSGPVVDIAGITRAEWQHFLDFYRPLEDDVLKSAMQTDFTAEGDRSGADAAAGIASARGTLSRNLSRAGTSLSSEERAALNRRTGTTLTRAIGQAENTTRRGLSDSRTDLLKSIVGIGRGVASTATSGLSSVADMAAQRQMQHINAKAQATSTNLSAAATAASLLIAFV